MSRGDDYPRTEIVLAVGSRFTPSTKALQIQGLSSQTKAGGNAAVTFADAFGAWYAVAPPPTQTVDALGTISAAAEYLTSEVGDQPCMHGSRDTRISKYGQDLLQGEFAFINSDGFRIMMGHKQCGMTAGGGFLNFDVENKKVGLAGIPATSGAAVPYMTITTSMIGMVSATGAASFSLSDTQATLTAPAISLEGGRVNLGVGAFDPVVTYSQLLQLVLQLLLQFNTHIHGGAPPTVPMVIVTIPGRRVFAPAF